MSDVKYNPTGFNRAHSKALQGKINRGETWEPPASPKPDDGLGTHTNATPGTKGRIAYPIVKGETLYRAGILAAKSEAARLGETEITAACDRLLKIIDEGKGTTAAKVTSRRKIAGLRTGPTTYSDKSVEVDEKNSVIKNVAIMTIGPTIGHGFDIDGTTLDQLVSLAAAKGEDGTKSRFKHPEITQVKDAQGNIQQSVGDDTGTMIGRVKNIRRDGNQARGDVYLGSYAAIMPGLGDVREYLIRHAKEDPAGIGMSAMFEFEIEPVVDAYGNPISLPARLTSLMAIDFVGVPAANPQGLLSANVGGTPDSSGWSDPGPRDLAKAPPVTSALTAGVDLAKDARGQYLRALVEHGGPMHWGSIAARCGGRLEAARAGADWLVAHQLATKTDQGVYSATPAGATKAAMCWSARSNLTQPAA